MEDFYIKKEKTKAKSLKDLLYIQDNIKIAIFMGYKLDNSFPDKGRVFRLENKISMDIDLYKYSESWDWIIPVVQKLQKAGYSIDLNLDIKDVYSQILKQIEKIIINMEYYLSDKNAIFDFVEKEIKKLNNKNNGSTSASREVI